MATEIEIKAWVVDAASLKKRLSEMGSHTGAYEKDDEYWKPEDGGGSTFGSGIRIRRTAADNEATINFKRKEVRAGMEINDEREFVVSDSRVFAEMLVRLGLRPWIRKRKTGESWDIGGITAELSIIAGLGTFVELEILADDDSPATVESARARLFDTLDRLGVGRDKIESRYYTEMLSNGI